jgi:four helix bundle protein
MNFHDSLKLKIHLFVNDVYKITKNFPRDELYGVTSQLRRAALSIILNYIEGFARRRGEGCKIYNNFLDISFGSLKEAKYLIYFSYTQNYLDKNTYKKILAQADEIGAMLFKVNN